MNSFSILQRLEKLRLSPKFSLYFQPKTNKLVDLHTFCAVITAKINRQELYLPVLTKWLARSGSARTEINQLSWITFLSSLLSHLNNNEEKIQAINALHQHLPPINLQDRQIRYALSQVAEHLPAYLWIHLKPFFSNQNENAKEIIQLMNEYAKFSLHEKSLDLAKSYLQITYTLMQINPEVVNLLFNEKYHQWPSLIQMPIKSAHELIIFSKTIDNTQNNLNHKNSYSYNDYFIKIAVFYKGI